MNRIIALVYGIGAGIIGTSLTMRYTTTPIEYIIGVGSITLALAVGLAIGNNTNK